MSFIEPDVEPENTDEPQELESWKASHPDIVASNLELARRSKARRASK